MHCKNEKGFTLLELIIVIAILTTLATVAIPIYTDVLESSRAEADKVSLVTLNQSSVAYAMINDIPTPDVDIFEGIGTDEARIHKLIDEKFLLMAPVAQQKDAEFNWEVDAQKWVISGGVSGGESGTGAGGTNPDDDDPDSDGEDPDEGGSTPPEDEGGTGSEPDLSGYNDWDPDVDYPNANTFVVYDGKLYYNLWWVNGTTLPGTNQVWQQVSDEWVYYNIYDAGDTTIYNGVTYRARYWTSQMEPSHSQYGAWEQISPPPV